MDETLLEQCKQQVEDLTREVTLLRQDQRERAEREQALRVEVFRLNADRTYVVV